MIILNNNVHLIKNKIFKKNIVKINFVRRTQKDEITKLNFLTHILLLSSKKYRSEREVLYKAKELYGLSMESFVNIYGNYTALCFRFVFLKDDYTESNNSNKALNFINELIFNPDLKGKKFNNKIFELAKNEVIDHIKMVEYMDPSSPAAIELVGNMEDLEKITPKNLYDFYLEVLTNSIVDIFAFGNLDANNLKFLTNKVKKRNIKYVYHSKEREPKTFIERDKINQSKLVIGYNLVDMTPKEAEYALQVYLYLLGLGPNSKLFTNVREKESLCYSIGVTAKYVNSLMVITAGIDAINFDKTVDLIDKQINDMKKGLFKHKDIESAKLSIKASYQEVLENPYSILNSYESIYYLGYDSIKKRIKMIDMVTKEDIIRVANKIKLNTIYLLEGKSK